jgi:photosynthetic reaction center cytochrome c subunit
MRNIVVGFAGIFAFLMLFAIATTAGWVHPPILSSQTGFRGLAMDQLKTPAMAKLIKAANTLPDPIDPAPPGTDKAKDLYQNVQVLGDLTVDQFNRVMLGMAAWVAPAEESCNYCHGDNMVSDDKYTKRVARRMLLMVRDINKNWKQHVAANASATSAPVGVVCYTCHRGAPVPKYTFVREKPAGAGGAASSNWGSGHPTRLNGSTALYTDPFTSTLLGNAAIRVTPVNALPDGKGASYLATERTYSLMIAISKSLGVNCDFRHNTRDFAQWDGAPPQRVTAWHGIQMVRKLNNEYLEPLKDLLPANRLGPLGDPPKVYCETCHQGVNKPLQGVSMAKDWPELGGVAAP